MSDVPLGAMLSGGLDSSLVVALMAEELGTPVETFSVGFREDAGSELADARKVATLFGTAHHELELSFLDDTAGLEELVWHLDEPVADLSALGLLASPSSRDAMSQSRCPGRAPMSCSRGTSATATPI